MKYSFCDIFRSGEHRVQNNRAIGHDLAFASTFHADHAVVVSISDVHLQHPAHMGYDEALREGQLIQSAAVATASRDLDDNQTS